MPTDPAPAEPTTRDMILSFVGQLDRDRIGTGPLAMLRRLDPGPGGTLAVPALHRLLAQLPDTWLLDTGMRRWALLIHVMAIAAPEFHHSFGEQGALGLALFEAGCKEGRLLRFLETQAEDLAVAVPRMVRFLVAKRRGFDPVGLGSWIDGIDAGGQRAERQRTQVARDYFRAERRADTKA